MTATGYSVLWRYMIGYFALAFTSFLCSAENPAATCSPSAAAESHRPARPKCLLAQHLFSAVLWDGEGFRLPTCVLFSAHAQAAFLPPAYPESRSVFPSASIALISGSSVCTCVYFRFFMTRPPDVVYFPTSGGLLSLSVFTGPVQSL